MAMRAIRFLQVRGVLRVVDGLRSLLLRPASRRGSQSAVSATAGGLASVLLRARASWVSRAANRETYALVGGHRWRSV